MGIERAPCGTVIDRCGLATVASLPITASMPVLANDRSLLGPWTRARFLQIQSNYLRISTSSTQAFNVEKIKIAITPVATA